RSAWNRSFLHLRHDEESAQVGLSKGCGHGDIGRISTCSHQDAPQPRLIVPSIKGPPAMIEIGFEPCAEIHGRAQWHSDVSQVPSRIASWNIQRSAKCNGQMLIIATHADAFSVDIESGLRGPSMLIVERNFVVDPIANCLHPSPAWRRISKQFKGDV